MHFIFYFNRTEFSFFIFQREIIKWAWKCCISFFKRMFNIHTCNRNFASSACIRQNFSNKAVNSVSTKTLYIYVIGGQFTALISHFNIVENNQDKLYLVFIVFGLSIAVFAAAYICAVLLEKPIELLSNLLYAIYNKLKQVAIKLYNKNAG